ncbi:MAG: hypothetical protein HN337_06035 [Deltaproteobacteria bacterium]|nr:hypothetical protein [Deltaproteobacteria bacterium]
MKTTTILLILFLFIISLGLSCADSAMPDLVAGSSDDGEATTGDEEITELTTVSGTYYTISDTDFFYTGSLETAPVVTEGSGSAQVVKDISVSSELISHMYYALQEYTYPDEEGVIDMHNVYKLAFEASNIYENAVYGCDDIDEQVIEAPFDFGITQTYDCAGNDGTMSDSYANGYAIKRDEDTGKYYAILTFRWASSEHGVMQGSYDKTTGDILLNMVEHVDHDESHFYVRSYLSGNVVTHEFTFRMITGSIDDSTNYTSLAGHGISKGDDNYFLFKAKTHSTDAKYFCLPAEPTVDELEDMDSENPDGLDYVESECSGYQSTVDALSFLDSHDVPIEMSDFTNSSILVDYE